MKNAIAIKENSINWLGIIDLAFKKKDWGKTYTLYTCGEVSITCTMNEFDFQRNTARFLVKCNYINDSLSDDYDNYNFLNYYLDNFTIKEFRLLVLKKIKTIIAEIIYNRTRRMEKIVFVNSLVKESNINDDMRSNYELLEDYNNIENILDEEIKIQCMNTLNEKILLLANEEYFDLIRVYCKDNKESNVDLDSLLEKILKLIEELEGNNGIK